MAARVTEHQPAAALPIAEVRQDIQRHLESELAMKQAEADGKAALDSLVKGTETKVKLAWSAPQNVSLQKRQGLHAEGAKAVFGADTAKLPVYVGVPAPQGKFVIYRISKVKDVTQIDAAQSKALARQLAQMIGQEQYQRLCCQPARAGQCEDRQEKARPEAHDPAFLIRTRKTKARGNDSRGLFLSLAGPRAYSIWPIAVALNPAST